MTWAPQTLLDFQDKCHKNLGTTDLGVVGDLKHVLGGGYHIGAIDLRKNGMSNDYSLEFNLDKDSRDNRACAADLGGTPELLMTLGNRLVHALKNRDPRVYGNIRGVNAPFDGVSIDRRYDCENPGTPSDDNTQSSDDRGHIHIEIYRTLVYKQSVLDGLYSVLAGEPAPPVEVDPNDPDWSEKVNRQEVVDLVREISDNRADQHVSAAVFGGNAGLHKLRPGLYPEAENGLADQLAAMRKEIEDLKAAQTT